MGQAFLKLFASFNKSKRLRVLMVGLDNAGKTTILYKLKLNEFVTTVPTIGFNVEEVKYKNLNFTIWDLGGQSKVRDLWKHYYTNNDAIIYVVDTNDHQRIAEAKMELHKMLDDSALSNVKVLILANKQDLPCAMNVKDLVVKLGLNEIKQKHWFCQPCIATSGTGIYEGLDWLAKRLK